MGDHAQSTHSVKQWRETHRWVTTYSRHTQSSNGERARKVLAQKDKMDDDMVVVVVVVFVVAVVVAAVVLAELLVIMMIMNDGSSGDGGGGDGGGGDGGGGDGGVLMCGHIVQSRP
jgi:hypothetical protein